MVRAAAKNFDAVLVVTDTNSYADVLSELSAGNGYTTRDTRKLYASSAFAAIERYDRAIAEYFTFEPHEPAAAPTPLPQLLTPWFTQKQSLRYGENPHQQAAFYGEGELKRPCVAAAEQLNGKELSYNNILDLDSALNLVREFERPAAVVVKHNNPCGAATEDTLAEAFRAAWDGDPQSAFGGILAFNRPLDVDTARSLMDPKAKRFIECVIFPDYDFRALDPLMKWKENVRLLKTGPLKGGPQGLDYRRVDGGLLVQTRDVGADDPANWKVVTKRQPTQAVRDALWFAWLVCKHVKSNAIVLANGTMVVGVGAGQMSRVDSVQIAIRKAGERVRGSVLASDAFFPFRDNVDAAAAAGVTAIVQPGGSQRDADSIAACDEHGIAMLFTGVRHFRH
jgi:phosphoribosylaminoimidazolecarboxamide formyltransferase/IMP cyclohydrolase